MRNEQVRDQRYPVPDERGREARDPHGDFRRDETLRLQRTNGANTRSATQPTGILTRRSNTGGRGSRLDGYGLG